jgi:predicted dehydrogenase
MANKNLTRRDFIRRSATGAAGLGYFLNGRWTPLEAAPAQMKPASPSDRVNIGFIGVGIRGHILTNAAIKTGQANLVVACDTYQGHLDRSKETTDGKIDTCFCKYKSVLDRKDIDAVIVATPDHWHTPIVLDALDAGKDVYIEKPMTHTIEEGPRIIEAVRRNNRVLQVGSQGRSSPLQKKAREIVASGQLGRITKIVASFNRNSATGAWNYPIPMDLKDGVNFNWEEWLGSAPQRPFDAERVFRYRKYWDYSGGITTDLFVHLITSIHFLMDVEMPRSVMAAGGILARKDGREVPDTLDALFDYDGFCVNMASTFNNASATERGIQILGTDGSLILGNDAFSLEPEKHREGYQYSIDSWPKDLQEQFWNEGNHREEAKATTKWEASTFEDKTDAVPVHMAEFFDCVRTRKECSENAVVGHHAASAGHMVNMSYRSGKKVTWDETTDTAIV